MAKHTRRTNESAQSLTLSRRAMLQGPLAAGSSIGLGASPLTGISCQNGQQNEKVN